MDEVESVLIIAQRTLSHLVNAKAWAAAKADTYEKSITAVGGAVPEELSKVLAEIRAHAA